MIMTDSVFHNNSIYKDIAVRTGGDIYIGVVGPVRTGKSTFIKRFMDLLVVPEITNEYARERLIDELPQSGSGKSIMTTQPKFIPNDAVELAIDEKTSVRFRMIDCVGYMVEGAIGHLEEEMPRMVRTPWYDYEIPFEEAAEIGTKKVMTEHSTIAVVMLTDGSITGIEHSAYESAEERVITELKQHGKPFVAILNTLFPNSDESAGLAETLSKKYGCTVIPADVLNMTAEQAVGIIEDILMEFPIRSVLIELPSWVRALGRTHWLVREALDKVCCCSEELVFMRDYTKIAESFLQTESFKPISLSSIELGSGTMRFVLEPLDTLFYTILSEQCGIEIADDYRLIATLKEFAEAKREYDKISSALKEAQQTGYGIVSPNIDEMQLDEPEIVQQGSRFGVKLKAKATGIHMIRVDVESEVSPLVGTEEQSEQFMEYLLDNFEKEPTKIWQTNIFGKPLYDLVKDGMTGKVGRMPDPVKQKLQETLQRMVNEGCNGLICIML